MKIIYITVQLKKKKKVNLYVVLYIYFPEVTLTYQLLRCFVYFSLKKKINPFDCSHAASLFAHGQGSGQLRGSVS